MSVSSFLESAVIEGDILTIRPRGDLDTVSAPEFDQAVQEHLDAGHSRIIVDCQRMGYISSLGLGSLVALQARLRRKGGVVKLDKVLDIYGDLEFARKSFEADGGSA